MPHHLPFWAELAGKIGPPVFAATLVACLMQEVWDPLHLSLMGAGLLLIAVGHWKEHHTRG